MGKKEWMQTVAEVGSADGVWFESVVGDSSNMSISLPGSGRYRVIFVKLDGVPNTQSAASSLGKRKISPRVRALRGAAKLNDSRDYKEILADALTEKLVALG